MTSKNKLTKKIRNFWGKYSTPFLLSIIIGVSLYPRLWNLNLTPPVNVDEPADLRDINIILKKGFNPTDFHWDWSKSYLTYSVVLIVMNIFRLPANILTLRISCVVLSIFGLPALFFLAKRYTNSTVAFLVTILYSYSYYFLQFSRSGGWINVLFVNTLGLYLFWMLEEAIERKSIFRTILASVLAGLIFYSYRSGIIYIAVSFLYVIVTLFKQRVKTAHLFLIYSLVFLIVILPWINKIQGNFNMYNLRSKLVSVTETAFPYHGYYDKYSVYKYQVVTSVKSWLLLQAISGGGLEDPRYLPQVVPPVNTVVRIGFWLGVVFALKNFRKTYYWFLIFVLALIFGQILTINPPNGARGLIMLPFIYLFFSLAFSRIYSLSTNRYFKFTVVLLPIYLAYSDFLYYQYWMTWIKV